MCWATYSAQGTYAKVPLSQVKPGCERPLTVEVASNLFAALGEAALVDSARMKFAPLEKDAPALVSHLDGEVACPLPFTSPWRFVMVAETPGRLLENNYLILNLNEPCALSDTSWIKPGKVLREVTLTTDGAKAAVDFCKKHHLQYILFDAGWYGHEYDDKADARGVNVDPKRSKGPLDLEGVIRYGKESGVGVILYVNRRALERQLDEILPLYRKWGASGVKYGFVNVGSQHWTTWLHDAVRKAAENHLVIDIHDEYRPTGYSRTYPNLLTQEGILGDEAKDRTNAQTLMVLFSRCLAGAADNTICYFDPRVDVLCTHAYQLAKSVCLFSPLQHLYWYDRPAPGRITEEPELEFFDRVPVVWDETRVLEGRIGESAVIARRSGDQWFVGIMQSGAARVFEVPLSFLSGKGAFTARIYRDDPATATRCHVKIEDQPVNATSVLKVPVVERGGAAIWIAPSAGR
jgi:alpha-glucosidase